MFTYRLKPVRFIVINANLIAPLSLSFIHSFSVLISSSSLICLSIRIWVFSWNCEIKMNNFTIDDAMRARKNMFKYTQTNTATTYIYIYKQRHNHTLCKLNKKSIPRQMAIIYTSNWMLTFSIKFIPVSKTVIWDYHSVAVVCYISIFVWRVIIHFKPMTMFKCVCLSRVYLICSLVRFPISKIFQFFFPFLFEIHEEFFDS